MKAGQWMLCMMVVAMLAACGRDGDQGGVDGPAPVDATAPDGESGALPEEGATPTLDDVIEHDPRYVVGISYPPQARRHPGLALELDRYARAARAELDQAVESLGQGRPSAPYSLSLEFTQVVDTPRVIVIAATGDSYTGGAHGNPLVARFVWLPQQARRLHIEELIDDAAGWQVLSAQVREQLHAALSQRVDAEALEPAERSQTIRNGGRMIDEGSTPEAANFEQFEPVMDSVGRIRALRFVFPPYQVGPYSEGTQEVVVPAAVLLPHVAPAYRGLFVGG